MGEHFQPHKKRRCDLSKRSEGRKLSCGSQPLQHSLRSKQPVTRSPAYFVPCDVCPDPVGKPVVVQLFLGPKWDSLEGKY